MTTETKEVKLLTARELAGKAGIAHQLLRRILRTYFNRASKTLAGVTAAAIFILEARS